MQKNLQERSKKGISLISLIITIIVIIILAAIVIFTGLKTPDSANFASFCQQVDNVQMSVTNKFADLKAKHAIEGHTRTDEQIYIEIAVGHDPEQYATMGTTIVNNDNKGLSIGTSTGIQNIRVNAAKDKEHSIGMNLPKIRESNTGWYVTKDGRVFNANGYVYDDKTYFTGSLYQIGSLPSNDTTNSARALAIYESIKSDIREVRDVPADGVVRYDVTFDTDGGSEILPQRLAEGEVVIMPEVPSKIGYKFGGWYKDENKTVEFDFNVGITATITIYAKWDELPKEWILTDNDENGKVSYGDLVTPKKTEKSNERFYVVTISGDDVILISEKTVDPNTNTQVRVGIVKFDNVRSPNSSVYVGSVIESKVNDYADSLRDSGITIKSQRLLTKKDLNKCRKLFIKFCQQFKKLFHN